MIFKDINMKTITHKNIKDYILWKVLETTKNNLYMHKYDSQFISLETSLRSTIMVMCLHKQFDNYVL